MHSPKIPILLVHHAKKLRIRASLCRFTNKNIQVVPHLNFCSLFYIFWFKIKFSRWKLLYGNLFRSILFNEKFSWKLRHGNTCGKDLLYFFLFLSWAKRMGLCGECMELSEGSAVQRIQGKNKLQSFFIIYYKNYKLLEWWWEKPTSCTTRRTIVLHVTSSSYFIKCSSCEKKFEHRPFMIIIASLYTEMCNKYYFYFQLQWPKD